MSQADLGAIAAYCDKLLRLSEFRDYEGAVNGLQASNRGKVTRIAAAVDASLATARLASEAGADLLLVHHGLFWGRSFPWTGKKYELLRQLLDNNLAVYSAHLPLDAHPKLGNNARLAAALGLRRGEKFLEEKGQLLGLKFRCELDLGELGRSLTRILGREPVVIPGGPSKCRCIGIVTGGAGSRLADAAREGVDTFVTGEGPHWTYAMAEESEINVFYGGHYATETFGVKALAEHLSKKFRVPWVFLDHPTGL
jgi:dinuclear metal center YbgI/SA1388 family protein